MSKASEGFVPDFSTQVGSGTRTSVVTRRYRRENSQTWFTSADTNTIGRRCKSPTVTGYHDPFTGHRKATNYTRIIHTCVNPEESFSWKSQDRIGDPMILQEQSGPIRAQGVLMQDGAKYSTSGNGQVNVHPDYINRALAEAYELLVDSKVNVGQALAELGETLGWLASLVRRFVEVLLIVRDALKGRIRSSAAHRKIYSNANRVRPRQVEPFGRRRQRNPSNNPNTDSRWRREAREKWWDDEAMNRWLRSEHRKGRRKRKPSKSKRVSSAWLEYQYALMPLVYDIYGTLEALKEGLRGDNFLFSVQRTIGGPVSPDIFCAATGLDTSIEVSGSVRESARVVYTGRMRASLLSAMVELGLNNPWAIAWELVPFSFVVDWILPIDKVLNSFTAPLGVTFVDGYLDKRIAGKFEALRLNPGLGRYISGTRPKAKFKLMAFQRVRYLTWPLVGAYMRSPFSYAHAASALALLAQLHK